MNKATKKWVLMGFVLLLFIGIVAWPPIRNSHQADQENTALKAAPVISASNNALSVDAEIMRYTPMSDRMTAIGSVIPFEEVDLMFEASGKVVAIYFREGQFVTKGTLLAKINDLPLQAELQKLEAQVRLAEDRVYRQRTLLEKDAVSQEVYETMVTEYNVLMAEIELVKANIAQTELRAPFDGVIGIRELSEGAFSSSGTRVATLAMVSRLKVDFSIPESYASEIGPGTRVSFSLRDPGGILQSYDASVYAVEPSVDLNTRTLRARAVFRNDDRAVVAGTYASIEIVRREIPDAISVPSEAIVPELGRNMVFVTRGGRAQPVEIETGLRTDSRVQALSGLQAGDTVLTTGVLQLRTGMDIIINNLN